MSEYTDAMIDRMLNVVPERNVRKHGFQFGAGMNKWRLRNGQLVEMRNMSTEHLQNALKLCQAKGNTAKADQISNTLEARLNPCK